MTIKTPNQIAAEVATDWDTDGQTRDQDVRLAKEAIEADRAQFFDTTGSASSQHYIDTGRYLLHEEVAEMERINKR